VAEATYQQPWHAGQGRGSRCDRASGWCMIPGNAPALLIRERMAATNKFLAHKGDPVLHDMGSCATSSRWKGCS